MSLVHADTLTRAEILEGPAGCRSVVLQQTEEFEVTYTWARYVPGPPVSYSVVMYNW